MVTTTSELFFVKMNLGTKSLTETDSRIYFSAIFDQLRHLTLPIKLCRHSF